MRIKFLGDCYYCVSGMPVNRPNHADMCVLCGKYLILMFASQQAKLTLWFPSPGLEMIKTIRQVRLATGVDVDMRIGVHTGSCVNTN